MQAGSGNSQDHEVTGTLRSSELEGGSWQLELDESHPDLGTMVVLQGLAPQPPLGDGSRVRARVRESETQFGIAMAPGPYVDVLELRAP
jgi:hypothetical protein